MAAELPMIMVWGIAAAAFLSWTGAGIYAIWRAGQLNDQIGKLNSLKTFVDNMIKSDRRYPVWIWKDGRVQASPEVTALLQLEGQINSIADLTEGSEQGSATRNIYQRIETALEGGKLDYTSFVADLGSDESQILVDIKRLMSLDDTWPSLVMWLEEYAGNSVALERSGVQALTHRVSSLSSALEGIPFPIWILDADMHLVEVNRAYVNAVDGGGERSVVRRNKSLFDSKQTQFARRVRESGRPSRERLFGIIGGQRRAFAVTHVYMPDDDKVLGIAVDVTGEEEALSELSRVLESQSETLNRLRSPVAIFGPGQTLRFYNSAFARLSHLPEDKLSSEIRHSELLDIMYEKRRLPEQADFKSWKEDLLKQYTTLLEPFEEMWHLPDGTAHRVVTQPHPLGGLLILFEDVTDRLALERSYNTLIAVQQETLDNMRESVAVFGGDGRLRLANPAFSVLWQLEDDALSEDARLVDLLKKVQTDKVYKKENRAFRETVAASISRRENISGRWYRADGAAIDYGLVPLPDGGMMLTQTDITDSFRIERALRERSRALEAADKLKSEFITNMSYELRTPLNSIIGFAEILDQEIFGGLNDRQKEYLQDILAGSGELKDMIADVLDLAVIEAGAMTLDVTKVDIAELLKASIAEGADILSKVEMGVKIDAPKTHNARGDAERLGQAFLNMISTMSKFSRSGSDMVFKISGKRGRVLITLVAEESGLSPMERDRLISTVAMGVSSGSRRSSGLDLALVRSIITLHGGSVDLRGVGQEGLELIVDLPRTPPLEVNVAQAG